MKLLTLNTHSLAEEDYPKKLMYFVEAIALEQPEIIALQEVNQTSSAAAVTEAVRGYFPCAENVVLKQDNHAMRAAELLYEKGVEYHWTWLPIKKGYDRFDEGIAVMSRSPILETETVLISETDDYNSWKTRKIVGVRTEALSDEWFFSVHFGRWDDREEPFRQQWIRTVTHMTKYEHAWVMGDFNAPADIRGEGYDLMQRSFWHDSYILAESKDGGVTVPSSIDGWHDRSGGMRIDGIWCSKSTVVTSSETIFNGTEYPMVSDHYGVLINYERSIV